MWRWRAAILSVIVYNLVGVVDIISTTIAIETGAGYEANPFLRSVMDAWGPWWIAVKLSLQAVVTMMVLYFPHWIVLAFFTLATALNVGVVHSNLVIGGVI